MNLEKAILTAIDFENKVRALYADAARKAKDEKGKRIFEVLAQEEQTHLDFLHDQLREWRASGKVTPQRLATAVPPQDKIKKGIKALKQEVRASGPTGSSSSTCSRARSRSRARPASSTGG
jgi:rubrerythrin